jgi:hypothetical protein
MDDPFASLIVFRRAKLGLLRFDEFAGSRREGGGNWVGVVSGVPNSSDSGVGSRNGDHAMTKDTMKEAGAAADPLLFDDLVRCDRGRGSGSRSGLHRDDAGGGTLRRAVASALRTRQTQCGWRSAGGRRRPARPSQARSDRAFGERRFPCRAPDWWARTAGRANGGAARFAPTSAAPGPADALIAGAYLSGTNTRRVRRALAAVFAGLVGKTWSAVRGAG